MVDLETFGTAANSVIASIGAVKFGGGQILSEFYRRIDISTCVDFGMTFDSATVMWWLQQSETARQEICLPGEDVQGVLDFFSQWIADEDAEVWGNGAGFDNALLHEAFRLCALPLPWKFYNDRCYRTVKNLYPEILIERIGTHHNALDDAKSQAIHLMKMLPL